MKTFYRFIILAVIVLGGCRKGQEKKTATGFKYILYTDAKGTKPKMGDYVTIALSYKNDNDSVLFDWKKTGTPIRFQLERIPFTGSFEEGLLNLSEGDSATFYVPADSLYKVFYANTGTPQTSTAFLPSSYLRFNVRLLKVQTPAQAEEEMLLRQSTEEKKEREEINSYVSRRIPDATADSSGMYIVMHEKGSGATIDSGKVVTIEYEAKFLNDSVFDGTSNSNNPYKFIFGAHRVIAGWEKAMKGLRQGDRFTLLVPSKLAYAEEGIRDPATSKWIIAPNTPLVFEIKIVDVEDAPPVSGR